MKVADAVEVLATTFQSLDSVAQGLEVKASEVATALAKAKPDTTEFVCLTVLARYNPVAQVIEETPQTTE
jgi:hypothetical protein